MASKTLFILYNADASVMGKLKYGYKKLTASSDCEPTCAACDITHGGISLNESQEWIQAKKEIEADSRIKVVQWHRDEISPKLKEFIAQKKLRYPSVVIDEGNDDFREVMTSTDLAECKGKPDQLVAVLKAKEILL